MVLAMIVTHYYMWYRLGIHFDWFSNMELTILCTVISLLRGYFFAKLLASKLKQYYKEGE